MVKLKTIYEKQDEIPEGYGDLYVERSGKWELTGIEGVKTAADVARVEEALRKERSDHKEVKDKLTKFGELEPDQVHASLEELTEAKAQLATVTKDGKINEQAMQERIEAAVARAVGPKDRENQSLSRQLDAQKKLVGEKDTAITGLNSSIMQGQIDRSIHDAAIAGRVIPTALDDAVLVGSRMFELVNGSIVTKDGLGVTPGLSPGEWLKDMQERRPHWWPASQGGGARGGTGAPGIGKENPWSEDGWSLTAQGKFFAQHGPEKAAQAAAAVNSKIGATKPTLTRKVA